MNIFGNSRRVEWPSALFPAGIRIFSELFRFWRLVPDRRYSISARLEEFPNQIEQSCLRIAWPVQRVIEPSRRRRRRNRARGKEGKVKSVVQKRRVCEEEGAEAESCRRKRQRSRAVKKGVTDESRRVVYKCDRPSTRRIVCLWSRFPHDREC